MWMLSECSFFMHLKTHEFRTEGIKKCLEVDLPPVTKFHVCRFKPTCTFQIVTPEKLIDHYAKVHNQRPWDFHSSRCLPPLRPIVPFPQSLFSIAQDLGACMIRKLYGKTTAVVVLTTLIPFVVSRCETRLAIDSVSPGCDVISGTPRTTPLRMLNLLRRSSHAPRFS